MNTFLPVPSFPHSAAMLDYRRLGKQRMECCQLLKAIRAPDAALPPDTPGDIRSALGERRKIGWVNHPAARMWRGHASALAVYTTFVIREWVLRGYNNTMIPPYDDQWQVDPRADYAGPLLPAREAVPPPWLGENLFHACHRSNLLRKDPEFYGQWGWKEAHDLAYMWPEQMGLDVNKADTPPLN